MLLDLKHIAETNDKETFVSLLRQYGSTPLKASQISNLELVSESISFDGAGTDYIPVGYSDSMDNSYYYLGMLSGSMHLKASATADASIDVQVWDKIESEYQSVLDLENNAGAGYVGVPKYPFNVPLVAFNRVKVVSTASHKPKVQFIGIKAVVRGLTS